MRTLLMLVLVTVTLNYVLLDTHEISKPFKHVFGMASKELGKLSSDIKNKE
jgi:hypothetical protein